MDRQVRPAMAPAPDAAVRFSGLLLGHVLQSPASCKTRKPESPDKAVTNDPYAISIRLIWRDHRLSVARLVMS